jgi:hypothetical protein
VIALSRQARAGGSGASGDWSLIDEW